MPSTYTANGGIEKIASGEQSGTWGATTNDNFDIIDRITNGVGSITLSGTSSNLQTSDGALSDGQYKVLVFGGNTSGTHTITVLPNDAQKFYLVINNTDYDIIFDQGSGDNATVKSGKNDFVYCDGAGSSAACSNVFSSYSPRTPKIDGYLFAANNLSDLDDTATALSNLGITASAEDLDLTTGASSGTIVNNRTAVYGDAGELNAGVLQISGTSVSATAAQLDYTAVTTLGTSESSKAVTADANGDVKFSNAIVETVYALTGTDLHPNNGTVQTKTITEDTTFTDSLVSGESMSLQLVDASAYTITWPTISWITRTGNQAPTLTDSDTIVLFKVSTTLYGAWIGSSD